MRMRDECDIEKSLPDDLISKTLSQKNVKTGQPQADGCTAVTAVSNRSRDRRDRRGGHDNDSGRVDIGVGIKVGVGGVVDDCDQT